MNRALIKIVYSFVVLAISPQAYAVVAGSNNSVSIQSQTFFPAADPDNAMNGFGWFKNGFILENSATSCIFNSVYPISGVIAMNGGTLVLQRDLELQNISSVNSFGTVNGNQFNFILGTGTINFPTTFATFENTRLIVMDDLVLTSTLLFRGNCELNGNNNTILLDDVGFIVVDSGSVLKLDKVTLSSVSGTNISCIDDTASIIIQDSTVEQSGDFFFSKGSISFQKNVDWISSFSFVYDSAQSSTISSSIGLNTVLHFSGGAVFQIGRYNSAIVEPLVFADRSSILQMENSTLIINSSGAQFIKGTLQISGSVVCDALGSTTANAFVIGDGIQADDFYFSFDPSSVYETNGIQVLNDVNQNILAPLVGGVTIISDANKVTIINQSQTISNLTSKAVAGSQTFLAPGVTLRFNNLTVASVLGSFTITGVYVSPVANALIGGQTIILNGALPTTTLVSSAGNLISGNGQVTAPIILQDSNAQLLWQNSGFVSSNMVLNNGTVSLLSDLNLGHEISITGPGNVLLNNQNINLSFIDYDQGFGWTGPLHWDGATGVINFNGGLSLAATWTLSGDVILVGNGNTLDVTNGQLVLEGVDSRLEFRNLVISGVQGNNIRILDNTGVMIVNNSSLLLDNDYSFTVGAIRWQNNVTLRGDGNNFIYESTQTSTVLLNTSLSLSTNLTFSYDTSSPNLFQFQDSTSLLVLNNAELFAGPKGLNLTVGSMVVNNGTLASDTSITLGDCFNAANDFETVVNNQLVVASGALNYKNVNAESWLMQIGSSLIIGDDSTLNVYQTLNMAAALTTFGLNTTLGQANQPPCNATFNGSISGSPVFTDIPCC